MCRHQRVKADPSLPLSSEGDPVGKINFQTNTMRSSSWHQIMSVRLVYLSPPVPSSAPVLFSSISIIYHPSDVWSILNSLVSPPALCPVRALSFITKLSLYRLTLFVYSFLWSILDNSWENKLREGTCFMFRNLTFGVERQTQSAHREKCWRCASKAWQKPPCRVF